MAGVSDLKRVFGSLKTFANRNAGPILEGNLTDLAPNSPIEQVARLNVPVLLAHGKLDRNVPVEDTLKLEAALKAAGKTVQAVYYDGDDHSMYLEADRMDFMKRLAAFLKDNLGPGSLAAAR
jgi:dipeptidyl aminopeptidase/acylaminoacyl peptidase